MCFGSTSNESRNPGEAYSCPRLVEKTRPQSDRPSAYQYSRSVEWPSPQSDRSSNYTNATPVPKPSPQSDKRTTTNEFRHRGAGGHVRTNDSTMQSCITRIDPDDDNNEFGLDAMQAGFIREDTNVVNDLDPVHAAIAVQRDTNTRHDLDPAQGAHHLNSDQENSNESPLTPDAPQQPARENRKTENNNGEVRRQADKANSQGRLEGVVVPKSFWERPGGKDPEKRERNRKEVGEADDTTKEANGLATALEEEWGLKKSSGNITRSLESVPVSYGVI